MKTLITNGRVVTATDDYKADILIEDERVTVIGAKLEMEVDKVIDASGRLVIPGGIDPHTHMELPFGGTKASDDFLTGTRAAAHGGTTTIIDFAVQYKGESLIQGIDNWHQKAEGKTAIDYGFHLITTELEDNQIEELHTAMDEGVTSFKMFMAYPGVFLVDDATIFRGMSAAGERGGLICMHAENGIVINDFSKIPNGAPGVENRVPLIYNGGVVENRISLNRFVELTSTAAAKMFGLFPKKGTIAVGSDADIVIFDENKDQTISVKSHHMNVDYSAYEGKKIKGMVDIVLSRGQVVIDNGEFKGKSGNGRFLKRGECVAI